MRCLVFGVVALLLMGAADQRWHRTMQFDIPAQSIATALNTLSELSGVHLLFRYDEVKDQQSTAVMGEYTLKEAVELMLSSTALSGKLTPDGVLVITAGAAPNSAGDGRKSFWQAMRELFGGGERKPELDNSKDPREANLPRKSIEEVVVTAEHRKESLQQAQASITAFSSKTIKALNITSASEVAYYTPNVTIAPLLGGRAGFSVGIRGVRNGESLMSFDPAVGIYRDGVLISKNSGSLVDMVDIERIEVLRGPQGTLYGRNTVGGAINIVTTRPRPEFEAELEATFGNFNQRDYRMIVNGPLFDSDSTVGTLNSRFSGALLAHDGYIENGNGAVSQDQADSNNRSTFTAQFDWRPGEWLNVLYSYDQTEHDEAALHVFATAVNPSAVAASGTPYGAIIAPQLAPYLVEQDSRPSKGYWDTKYIAELDIAGHAINADLAMTDRVDLNSITAYRTTDNRGQGDTDGSPLPIFFTQDFAELEVFSQELRLLGESENADLKYVLGLFYLRENGEQSSRIGVLANSSIGVADWKVEASAAYMQATYSFNERWDITTGVRYTREKREMERYFNGIRFPRGEKKFGNTSPMVAVRTHWNEDVMTYAKISRGYTSGGFNSRDQSQIDFVEGFDEETLTAYEIGWKSRYLDRRVRLNGAVFYSDYDDKQVNNLSVNSTTPTNVLRNAALVEIYGMELELTAYLTESIEVGLDYGYLEPSYKRYRDTDGSDLSHYNFPYSPQHSIHTYLTWYIHEIPVGQMAARIDWSYLDEFSFLAPSPEPNSGGDYGLWNARISWSDIPGPGSASLDLSLWGKNITDESYWNFGVNLYDSLGYTVNSYGPPRTFGLDVTFRFH